LIKFKINVGKKKPENPPQNISRETILNLNRVDNAIYHHFLAKFEANVERFGYQNMQHEIQDLKYSEDQFSKDCDSLSSQLSIKQWNISAMGKQEMNCWVASGGRSYITAEWVKKQQSTYNK
jgi:Galactose-3-O-sulfotransferase